jgi:hypothetical protein
MLPTEERNARIIAALKRKMPHVTNFSHDVGLPTRPVGHPSGIGTATRIVRGYRKLHRPGSQHVEPQEVIDVMLPSNLCYEAILETYHISDPLTGHRIPTLEGACTSKFAALVSPYREWERKQQDAVDLRSIMLPNQATLDRDLLKTLGDLVYPDGGAELLEYLQLAIDKKPFPAQRPRRAKGEERRASS